MLLSLEADSLRWVTSETNPDVKIWSHSVRGGQHFWHRLTGAQLYIHLLLGQHCPGHLGHYHRGTGTSETLLPSGSHRVWELFGSQTFSLRDGTAENLCCKYLALGWDGKGTALAFSFWCCQPLVTLFTSSAVKSSFMLSPPGDQFRMIQEALLERQISQGWGRIQ